MIVKIAKMVEIASKGIEIEVQVQSLRGMPTFTGKKNWQIEKELFREIRGDPWESIIREPKEKECFKNIMWYREVK